MHRLNRGILKLIQSNNQPDNVHQKMRHIVIIWGVLISSCLAFYVEIQSQGQKCFLMAVFPKQNLLLEIETPLIKERLRINLKVYSEDLLLFSKELKKSRDRITVNLNNSDASAKIQEISSCIQTQYIDEKGDKSTMSKYLIWFTQLGNFKHKLSSSQGKEVSKEEGSQPVFLTADKKQVLVSIQKSVRKIQALYGEQVDLHKNQEPMQSQNHFNLVLSQLYIEILTFIEIVFTASMGGMYLYLIKHVLLK